jgi:hypothetical protein
MTAIMKVTLMKIRKAMKRVMRRKKRGLVKAKKSIAKSKIVTPRKKARLLKCDLRRSLRSKVSMSDLSQTNRSMTWRIRSNVRRPIATKITSPSKKTNHEMTMASMMKRMKVVTMRVMEMNKPIEITSRSLSSYHTRIGIGLTFLQRRQIGNIDLNGSLPRSCDLGKGKRICRLGCHG